jgi:hypothetical protein
MASTCNFLIALVEFQRRINTIEPWRASPGRAILKFFTEAISASSRESERALFSGGAPV